MSKLTLSKLSILGGGLMLTMTAQAELPSSEMLANTCVGCHGPNGVSQGPATPTIAGISEEYFNETMQTYRDGSRPSTIMTRIAKGYSDEEIALMGGYFAKQPFVAVAQSSDAAMAAEGAKLHEKYCEKCHEEGGTSSEDDAGILAGQWTPYLEYTMEDFHSGAREMVKKMKKRMKKMQKKKGDKATDQLIQYYAGYKK